jgi:UDPglucose 6-dehydrogenase
LKILVCGAGYVGSANALMLSSKNKVYLYDINKKKISAIKQTDFSYLYVKELDKLPIDISNVNIMEKLNNINFDFIILALPTDSNSMGKLDVSSIINLIKKLKTLNIQSPIIIKSTLPIGGSDIIKAEVDEFLYIPEFLKEGTAVYDSFYPSRIIVGGNKKSASDAISMYKNCILNDASILEVSHTEAECIKLFSNTYLAMRVAFFNEIDTFMLKNNIRNELVIRGMSLDKRIGDYYNNPSFGYGGYCLPKDTEEAIITIDSEMISKINDSNQNRINEIARYIIQMGYKNIGVYKLVSKSGSNRICNSSTIKVINELRKYNKKIYIYDLNNNYIEGCNNVKTIKELFHLSDIVLANRIDKKIEKYKEKIFTRDIFSIN